MTESEGSQGRKVEDLKARMVGAGDTLEVGGKEYKLSPITIRGLAELSRKALQFYKRQFLETFRDNADLLGDGDGKRLLVAKIEECARWTTDDLPRRLAFSAFNVPVTKRLRRRLIQAFPELDGKLPDDAISIRSLATMALDSKRITPEQVKSDTGHMPQSREVGFDEWWVTGPMEGMIALIYASVVKNHPEVTTNEIEGWPLPKVAEAARMAERLSAASVGNM